MTGPVWLPRGANGCKLFGPLREQEVLVAELFGYCVNGASLQIYYGRPGAGVVVVAGISIDVVPDAARLENILVRRYSLLLFFLSIYLGFHVHKKNGGDD